MKRLLAKLTLGLAGVSGLCVLACLGYRLVLVRSDLSCEVPASSDPGPAKEVKSRDEQITPVGSAIPSAAKQALPQQAVSLTLVPDANELVPHEPLRVTVSVRNVSKQPVRIPRTISGRDGWYLDCAYGEGPFLPCGAGEDRLTGPAGLTIALKPGESWTMDELLWPRVFSSQGTYRVRARVRLVSAKGMGLSSVTTIVVRPSPMDSRAGQRLVASKAEAMLDRRWSPEGTALLEELVSADPAAPHADHARYALGCYYMDQDSSPLSQERAYSYFKRISRRVPRLRLRAAIHAAKLLTYLVKAPADEMADWLQVLDADPAATTKMAAALQQASYLKRQRDALAERLSIVRGEVVGLLKKYKDEPDGRWLFDQAVKDMGPRANESLPALVGLLESSDGKTRVFAAYALIRIKKSDELAFGRLVTELRAKDAGVRVVTAKILGSLGSAAEQAVPLLLAAINDKDRQVRLSATNALGDIRRRPEEVVPALAAIVANKRENVANRVAAANCLSGYGTQAKSALPILIETLQDKDAQIRRYTALALSSLRQEAKPALKALIGALKDESPHVRPLAAATLGYIGPDAQEATPALTEALDDRDPAVREAAEKALKRIQGRK